MSHTHAYDETRQALKQAIANLDRARAEVGYINLSPMSAPGTIVDHIESIEARIADILETLEFARRHCNRRTRSHLNPV